MKIGGAEIIVEMEHLRLFCCSVKDSEGVVVLEDRASADFRRNIGWLYGETSGKDYVDIHCQKCNEPYRITGDYLRKKIDETQSID